VETLLHLTEAAVPANVRRIRHRVADAASEAGASTRVVDEVALCVSEAVTNAAMHAYEHVEGEVTVLVQAEDDLVVVVRDDGRGLGEPRAGTNGGGFGLRIIKALSRDLSISSLPSRGTEVRMRFALERDDVGRRSDAMGQRAA
jgi:anti-sigma regulatory factor (Ser/Thr protein kinase)